MAAGLLAGALLALCAPAARADDVVAAPAAAAPAPVDDPTASAPALPAAPPPAERAPRAATPPPRPAVGGFPVGVEVGYVFRSVDARLDDRNHGVAAAVVVDTPPLLWGFGLRGEALTLAWPGGDVVKDPLAVFAGGAALTWKFDDTAVAALVAVGAVGGVVVEADVATPVVAPTLGLLLRFPLSEALALEGRLVVPFLQDDRFTLQAAALIGLSISPDVVVAAALAGRSPLSLLLPAFD